MGNSLEDCRYSVLRQMMYGMGIETASEMGRRLKLRPSRFPDLARFLAGNAPTKIRNVYGAETDQWSAFSCRLARYFKCPPEKLFSAD